MKLREVTEEEQPADLAELLEELDEKQPSGGVPPAEKKEVATEAFAYMSDEARDDLVNAFSDVELVGAIEDMSLTMPPTFWKICPPVWSSGCWKSRPARPVRA